VPNQIQQGHLYQYGRDTRVIAVGFEPKDRVRVRTVDDRMPLGMGAAYVVNARNLKPLPMKYFAGQVPQ
jgi:hypothetical protein